MHCQLAVKEAKCEVLIAYWDKMVTKIQMRASKKKDEKATLLVRQFCMVPHAVKRAMIRHYIKQCRQLHSIAFL